MRATVLEGFAGSRSVDYSPKAIVLGAVANDLLTDFGYTTVGCLQDTGSALGAFFKMRPGMFNLSKARKAGVDNYAREQFEFIPDLIKSVLSRNEEEEGVPNDGFGGIDPAILSTAIDFLVSNDREAKRSAERQADRESAERIAKEEARSRVNQVQFPAWGSPGGMQYGFIDPLTALTAGKMLLGNNSPIMSLANIAKGSPFMASNKAQSSLVTSILPELENVYRSLKTSDSKTAMDILKRIMSKQGWMSGFGALGASSKMILKKGSNSPDVGEWQTLLKSKGFAFSKRFNKALVVDNDFGPITEDLTKEFQKSVGFTGKDVDGKVGPKTLGKAYGISTVTNVPDGVLPDKFPVPVVEVIPDEVVPVVQDETEIEIKLPVQSDVPKLPVDVPSPPKPVMTPAPGVSKPIPVGDGDLEKERRKIEREKAYLLEIDKLATQYMNKQISKSDFIKKANDLAKMYDMGDPGEQISMYFPDTEIASDKKKEELKTAQTEADVEAELRKAKWKAFYEKWKLQIWIAVAVIVAGVLFFFNKKLGIFKHGKGIFESMFGGEEIPQEGNGNQYQGNQGNDSFGIIPNRYSVFKFGNNRKY